MNLEGVLACCAVCNQQTHRRCGRCLNIYYCNTEHQRQDWRRHKSDCAPKLQKQGRQKDKVGDHSISIADDSKCDKEKEINNKVTENTKDLDQEIETKELKKSKRKNVKKEGRVITSEVKTSQTENITLSSVSVCSAEHSEPDKTLKDSCPSSCVTSSVVYTNSDLTKESAIVYEGSSEQVILSESAQQLGSLDFTTASTSNVLKTVNKSDSKMLAIPGYNTDQNMRTREYPEATLKGSAAPFNNVLNSYYMDPADPSYDLCQRVIQDMTQYGVCVLNNFLGKERGLLVLKEVLEMYRSGIFKAGQLVSNPGSTEAQTVRSDRITWIDGKEPHCFHIRQLISQVDNIILKANKMANNGKMGNYIINGRTKAMVACYPGSGTHYVKHVDNPNKDGRCITAIYYLNLDWDKNRHGGLLRVFPEGTDKVADIEPIFDRMLFFWSDRRNPHEVQPAYATRYAITLWYFDAKEREEARRNFNKRVQPPPS